MSTVDAYSAREEMVDQQIIARGVQDPLVIRAMLRVPRQEFIPSEFREFAYNDAPVAIGKKQTISQPYIVALMIEALCLSGGEKVLEIGTGSGYAAAVLAEIAGEVYTVERIKLHADRAREILHDLSYRNVQVLHGDGTRGLPEQSPFDAIIVAAGGPRVPKALKSQLAIGGRLVIPVGSTFKSQKLQRIVKVSQNKFETEFITDVRFVPLIGDQGWQIVRNKEIDQEPNS